MHRGTRLCEIKRRSHTHLIAPSGQTQALFIGAQCILGELEQFTVSLPGEVGIGHARNDADLGRASGLGGRQIRFQCLLAETGDATKQIQLVRTDSQVDVILAGNTGLTGLRLSARQSLPCSAGVGANRRKQVSSLDSILRPVRLNVQCRDLQVAVIDQGSLNQSLQRRIAEKLAPPLLHSGLVGSVGCLISGTLRILRSNWCLRSLILRDQRATTQNSGADRETD